MGTSGELEIVNPSFVKMLTYWFSGIIGPKLPKPQPTRYYYETRGERRDSNSKVTKYGTYRFKSYAAACDGVFAMIGGHSRSGKGMFDYMTPVERVNVDTGERTTDFERHR